MPEQERGLQSWQSDIRKQVDAAEAVAQKAMEAIQGEIERRSAWFESRSPMAPTDSVAIVSEQTRPEVERIKLGVLRRERAELVAKITEIAAEVRERKGGSVGTSEEMVEFDGQTVKIAPGIVAPCDTQPTRVEREVFRCGGRLEQVNVEVAWEDDVGEVMSVELKWCRIDEMSWSVPLEGKLVTAHLNAVPRQATDPLFVATVRSFWIDKYDGGLLGMTLQVLPVAYGLRLIRDLMTTRCLLTLALAPVFKAEE